MKRGRSSRWSAVPNGRAAKRRRIRQGCEGRSERSEKESEPPHVGCYSEHGKSLNEILLGQGNCHIPGMSEADYRSAIAEYIRVQAKPPDKFSHQPRLYTLACALAEGKPFDDDVLYAAAWLHDLGVFIG